MVGSAGDVNDLDICDGQDVSLVSLLYEHLHLAWLHLTAECHLAAAHKVLAIGVVT